MACQIRIFKSETKTAQNITKKNDDDRAFSLILADNRTRTTTSFLHDPTTNKSIHLIYIFYVFTIFTLLVNQQSGKIFCCDDGGNFSNVDCSVPKVTEATESNPVHYSINEHVIHPSSSLSMLNLVAQATNNELTSNNANGTETNGSSTTIENHNNNHHRQQQPPPPPPPRRKPELGFGNFHFPEDDEEDEEENYDDGFSMIDRDDDETTSVNSEGDLHQENQQPNDSSPFDIDQLLLNQPRIERILIVGDGHKLLQPLDNYLMQQATPIDFDGCYCDHHHHHHHNHHDQPPQQPRPDYLHRYQFNTGHHSDHSSLDSNETNNGTASFDQHPQQQQQESSPTVATTIYCYCFGETIHEIPRNFSKSVRKIVLKQVGLETLRKGDLQLYSNLTEIFMQTMHHLHTIEPGAFSQLPHLMSIYIKMAPQLQKIMDGVFVGSLLKLTHLKITHSGLERFPMIRQDNPDEIISMIDFDNSRIRNITKGSIVVNAESVYIEYNQIEFISNYAFHGSKIEKLSLKGNKKLVNLQEHAFSGLYLRELDLSQTSITKLPTNGLSVSLEILRITDTFTMKEIPFIYHFESMKEAYLTYPYHCCAFKFPANHDPIEYERIKNLFNADKFCFGNKDSLENDPNRGIVRKIMDSLSSFSTSNHQKATTSSIWNGVFSPFFAFTSSPSSFEEQKLVFEKPIKYRFKRNTNTKSNRSNTINEKGALEMAKQQITSKPVFGVIVYNDEGNANQSVMVHHPYEILENRIKMADRDQTEDEEDFFKFNNQDDFNHFNNKNELPGKFGIPHKSITPKQQEFCGNIETRMQMVKCFPTPDAFNPCEDVMGKTYLRVVVWFVAFAAVSGNVSVIVVLMSSRFTFNVSKFLMINLSFADLMMGVYLFIIAVVDLRTQGVYFNYAIDWQHGIGCKVAGFITVFAQLLSIFTLTVITLERLFAITYAIQLNRRLKLNLAVKVMIAGWILVILLASLPLFGISSYSKTSICLPMEHKSISDVVYLVALLLINQFSFVIICACYSKMYFSIISQKTRATMNDMTIAKRMALLVFTDFACWAPIAFFGLTAIAGYPLIDVTNSKILLVTIYPLNSCANPFLYVIFTKQYRRDFFILVSRYGLCKTKALRYKPARNFHPINQHHHHHHHAHHHQHRTTPNTSDLMQKYNQCGKSNQVCSCPLQSFESSNLHIYQHKGQHHHHYCALYNCELSSQHCMICNPNSCSGHGSKSDNNETSRNIEDKVIGGSGAGGAAAGSSNALCMNCTVMQQDFDSNNSRSLEEMEKEEKKHRKHKRCHHYPTSLSYCKYQQRGQNRGQHQHNQNHSSCNYSGSNHSNNFIKIDSPNSCNCLGGNVDLCQADPPSRNSNDGCRKNVRRHLECPNRNGPNSNENSAHNNEKKECSCSGMKQHQPRSDDLEMMDSNNPTSSSCEKVHIIRNHCKHSSCLEANGKVIFTRQRNPQLLMPANEELQKSTSHQHVGGGGIGGNPSKRSSIFSSIFRRMSMFTKATESSTCGSHNDNHRSHHKNDSGSESGSPFSSSNSSSHHVNRRINDHHHHHYKHYCHHYRRCYHCHNPVKRKQLAENSATEAEEKDDTITKASCNNNNPLPIEQEREILHQALKETTTILEAVAVVEELSSGARISSMASSSSSKTKT